MKILLNQNSDAGKPASEPAAAAVVAAGKKTERERELETENESLKAAVEKTAAAKPTVSAFRFMPGPAVVVIPMAPPKAAPRAEPTPAISSSAWKV